MSHEQPDDHASDRLVEYPSRTRIGAVGAWWFARLPVWTRRHVETVEIESEKELRRKLRVDIELPVDLEASFPGHDGRNRLYFIPLVQLSKDLRQSHLELKDERGTTIHPYTRAENAVISTAALQGAALALNQQITGDQRAKLNRNLKILVSDMGGEAHQLYPLLVGQLLLGMPSMSSVAPEISNLINLVQDLTVNSMLWVPLVGTRGERRSVTLAYHVSVVTSSLLRTYGRPLRITANVRRSGRTTTYRKTIPSLSRNDKTSRYNERATIRRLWNRFAQTIGFAPYILRIGVLQLRHTNSYHLQVESPPGLEARGIGVRGKIFGPGGIEVEPVERVMPGRAHLYLSGIVHAEPSRAVVQFRLARKGTLLFSALTGICATGLLYFISKHAPEVYEKPSAAAPAMLVIPALLIIFWAQPDEHPTVTRIMAGIRLTMFLIGVCLLIAVLALAGGLLGHGSHEEAWRPAQKCWSGETVVVGLLTVFLLTSRLLAVRSLDRLRELSGRLCSHSQRYLQIALMLALAQGAVVLGLARPARIAYPDRWLVALLILWIGALAAWIAAHGEIPDPPRPQPAQPGRGWPSLLLVTTALAGATAPVFLGYMPGIVSWSWLYPRVGLAIAAIVVGVVVTAPVCSPVAPGRRRRGGEQMPMVAGVASRKARGA